MADKFDYFVIFAEMRTGSNYLEGSLNEFDGITCYGEAFNPYFMGYEKRTKLCGVTIEEREKDPLILLQRMQEKTDGIPGFRFFTNHDPRILEHCLADPRCAKINLIRNPLDSYISRRIAWTTGMWKLSDLKSAKSAKAEFIPEQFELHLSRLQFFQLKLLHSLQTSGQTAFNITYDDLSDIDVLNGLAAFLGVEDRKEQASQDFKVQNPYTFKDKVSNYEEMKEAIRKIDYFDLSRTPNFEPRRAPAVPSYAAAAEAPLLYQPVKSGPEDTVHRWLAAIDGVGTDGLLRKFNQKTLRQWKRRNRGHRCFTVVRHPVARLHSAFVTHFLTDGPETYWEIHAVLRERYGVPLPEGMPDDSYDAGTHKAAFLGFARFVQGNLSGQTSLRVDASWASQSEVLKGMAQVSLPDAVLREADLQRGLDFLADEVGVDPVPVDPHPEPAPVALADIYDETVEDAVRSAYQRDYMTFGFGPWRPGA